MLEKILLIFNILPGLALVVGKRVVGIVITMLINVFLTFYTTPLAYIINNKTYKQFLLINFLHSSLIGLLLYVFCHSGVLIGRLGSHDNSCRRCPVSSTTVSCSRCSGRATRSTWCTGRPSATRIAQRCWRSTTLCRRYTRALAPSTSISRHGRTTDLWVLHQYMCRIDYFYFSNCISF